MADNNPNPERERRILEAAAKLIAHYGFDKTTVSDIANEAGISKGAVYLHYKSKDDLFDALIIHEGMKMLDVLIQRMEADPDAGSIFALYQHAMVTTYGSPLVLALMRRDARVLGDMARRLKDKQFTLDSDFIRHELVTQLQAANVIRKDVDANIVAYVLAIIKSGFIMIGDFIPNEDAPPLDEVGKTIGQILERGLAPEGGSDKQAAKAVMEQFLYMTRDVLNQHRGQSL
ncbi:MAG: TetR/AcrR family transcriptional regulator [Chloroflexi bacterium]|nr:TetR/AcrR family transcriptional regulator [Chloroflexota bacterium]